MSENKQNRIVTIPNILSTIRLILLFPIGYYLWNGQDTLAGILSIIGGLLDISDGYIARKFDQQSELGKILDPLADKLIIGMLVVILFLIDRIPLWFVMIVILRDLLLIFGGLYAFNKLKFVLPSNYPGKLTALSLGLCLLFAIFDLPFIVTIFMWFSVGIMVYSFVLYLNIMLQKFKTINK